jgi:hypothetical protein
VPSEYGTTLRVRGYIRGRGTDMDNNERDWYAEKIEEPIRELVRVLRNNGINTTGSCGHEMYIQMEHYFQGGCLGELHNVLYNYLTEHGLPVEYDITVHLEVERGLPWRCWAEVRFPQEGGRDGED